MIFWKEWRETISLFLVLLVSIVAISHIRWDDWRLEFFEVQFWVIATLCLAFAAPFLGAGAIAAEKEGGTFDMLLARPVGFPRIVLTKYFVRLGGILFVLALLLGIFYYVRPTHNLDLDNVVRGLVILFSVLCFLLSASFCLSCFAETPTKALIGGIVVFFMTLLVINATPFFKYAWWWHNSIDELWLGYLVFYMALSIVALLVGGICLSREVSWNYDGRHLAIAGIILFLVFIRSVSSTFWLIPAIAISGDVDFIRLCREPVVSILDYTSQQPKHRTDLLRRYLANSNASQIDAELIQELKNPQARIRNEAMRVLVERKSKKAAAAAVPLLNDPDYEVVHSAISLVQVNKSEDAVPELIRLLDHENSSIRSRAIFALAEIEEKNAAPYLLAALEDKNPRVMGAAAISLCRMDYGEAQDEIVRIMLEDPVKHTRRSMIAYLGLMKSAPACDALIQVLSTDDEKAVDAAINSLGRLQCEEAVAPLAELLKSNPEKAPLMVRYITDIGGPEAIAVFRDLFSTTRPGSIMKTEAALALAKLGDPMGIPYLRDGRIINGDQAVRLAEAGDYGAVPTLIRHTETRWPQDKYTYGKALEELSGKNYGWDTRLWKRWWAKNKDALLQDMLSGNVHRGGT
jgi:HEAT repeat protein